VSDPVSRDTEISGLFSGQLDFVTNKKDFDFEIDLYELTSGGEYIQLSFYKTRASYMKDRRVRRLLHPGTHQLLTFTVGRLTSRQFWAGSRLVVEDALEPLQVRWMTDSFIQVPSSN
jgi:hypothetical protein